MAALRKLKVGAIVKAAQSYRDNLLNRNILLVGVDRDGGARCITLRFLARHFKHLTGVRTRTKMPAKDFFNRAIENRLPESEVLPDASGFAELKLKAAGTMFKPGISAKIFGDPSGARLHVDADKYAGNDWACLGFIEDSGWYDPITLLSSPARDEVSRARSWRVVAVFSKGVGETRYGAPLRTSLKESDDWEAIVSALPEQLGYLSLSEEEDV